jgi:predicted transcriptional regulator
VPRIDVVRRREESKSVTDLYDGLVLDQAILFSGSDLVEVAVLGNGWRRDMPELLAGHLPLVNYVVNSVNLDVELVLMGLCGLLIGHGGYLLGGGGHQYTTIPRQLTTVRLWWHNESMKPAKAMTIRLSEEQAQALATVADVDAVPVVEVIRAAISQHVESRKKDAQFQKSLRERIDRARTMLSS